MNTLRRFPLLLACALLSIARPSDVEGRGDQRALVERHVFVGVTGENGAAVEGLTPDDFIVREDGVLREVVRVSSDPAPSHLALLVDDTGDASPVLLELRDSLVSFVLDMSSLPAPPAMSLTTLAERPTLLADFTTSDIALENAIKRLVPRRNSGSYFMDAVIEACQLLRRADAERPVVVAFVIEASPSFSNLAHTAVAEALEEAGASLWTVVLQQSSPSTSVEARERARVVSDVTGWSGGRNQPALSRAAISRAFSELSAAIRGRYDVTYGRPEALIPPSRLSVELRDRTLRVVAPRWPRP